MTYCRGCGHQIHETAFTCPQCGAVQQPAKATTAQAAQAEGSLWLPVPALVSGLCAVLALFDTSAWNQDQAVGVGIFAGTAIALGITGVVKQKRGSGMSIAGVVLGAIGLLGAVGTQL